MSPMTGEVLPPFLTENKVLESFRLGFMEHLIAGDRASGWVSPDGEYTYTYTPLYGPGLAELTGDTPTVLPDINDIDEWSVFRQSTLGLDGRQKLSFYVFGWSCGEDENETYGLVSVTHHDIEPLTEGSAAEQQKRAEQLEAEIAWQHTNGLDVPSDTDRAEFDAAIRGLIADTARKCSD